MTRNMSAPTPPITLLLQAHAAGDPEALGSLFRLVYRELRELARRQRRRLDAGHTLDSVALVGECYLKLAGGAGSNPNDRNHFFAVAAKAMRHLLVDHARARSRAKRKGVKVELNDSDQAMDRQVETVLAVQQGLDRLAEVDERLVAVVECRFFAGYSVSETASALQLSERTVQRCWQAARSFLGNHLQTKHG